MPPGWGGIRTRNPNKQPATDTRLEPRDHWDRRTNDVTIKCRATAMLVLSAVQIYAKGYCEETLYTPRFTETSTQAQNLLP